MSWLSKAARKVKRFFKSINPQTWRDLRRIRDDAARAELERELVQLTDEGRRLLDDARARRGQP